MLHFRNIPSGYEYYIKQNIYVKCKIIHMSISISHAFIWWFKKYAVVNKFVDVVGFFVFEINSLFKILNMLMFWMSKTKVENKNKNNNELMIRKNKIYI